MNCLLVQVVTLTSNKDNVSDDTHSRTDSDRQSAETQAHPTAARRQPVELYHRLYDQMDWLDVLLHFDLRLLWARRHFANLRGEVCPHGTCRRWQVHPLIHAAYRQVGRVVHRTFRGRLHKGDSG